MQIILLISQITFGHKVCKMKANSGVTEISHSVQS